MNDSREFILNRVKKNLPEAHEMPHIPRFTIPGNSIVNFVSHLKGFDGDYKLFTTRDEALDYLKRVKADATGRKVLSSVSDVAGNVTLNDFEKPADMHVVDVCIAQGIMAVGETGSVLVDTRSLGSPAGALFSTDLYLLVDRESMVEGLQDAYSKINLADYQYSAFFSGPSATADVEAVHVTGAQGEISLTVVMYNCTPIDKQEVAQMMTKLPQGTPLGQPGAPELNLRRHTDPSTGTDSV